MTRTYKDIKYTLKKNKRKTASIYIERDGKITVLVPEKSTEKEIHRIIEKKRPWIYRHLAEWKDLNATRIEREYVNGEGFLYLGRTYRLKIVKSQKASLLLKNGHFCLDAKSKNNGTPEVAFKDFYRVKGMVKIPERIQHYQTKTGLKATGIKVIDLKNRWASCTAKGSINFHWKCMMAPLTILDYIIVHELAHLKYPRHTQAFWNQIDKVLPDYQERKQWLKVNGAGMGV